MKLIDNVVAKLEESIADLIYQIDNREFNNLSKGDLKSILERLKRIQ